MIIRIIKYFLLMFRKLLMDAIWKRLYIVIVMKVFIEKIIN